ncbi:MAG: Flp family type IVb pilin [Pseudomonadota bacterium]
MFGLTILLQNRRGATAIEYALIASLISITAIVAMLNLGGGVNAMFQNVSSNLQ